MPGSLVLAGGRVHDGDGGDPIEADVLVVDDRIAGVGDHSATPADERVELDGLDVAPGFIDVHTHSDVAPFLDDADELRLATLRQGVTTEICGNCGFSVFPSLPERRPEVDRHLAALFGGRTRAYETFAGYTDALAERRLYTNLVSLIGHGTLRAGVLGFGRRRADPDELGTMKALLRDALDDGVAGLSSGLIYPPGVYAPPEELAALAAVAASYGRPYTTHIRDEVDHVVGALEEAIAVARTTDVAVHISHHKVAGRRNWGRSAETLALIDRARHEGIDISLDLYPYLAGSTVLSALLPPWVAEGGVDALLERLATSEVRSRLARELEDGVEGWQSLVAAAGWDGVAIASAPRNPSFEGRRIDELALEASSTPVELVCDLLVAEGAAVMIVAHMMTEADVRQIMAHPLSMIGSDGIPLPGKPHPRWAGTFTRVLGKYARDARVVSLPEAVRKMTGAAADRFSLADRGRVRPGLVADLVVFSPDEIHDAATYEEPLQRPRGVRHVLVNGELAVRDGKPTGTAAGRVVRA